MSEAVFEKEDSLIDSDQYERIKFQIHEYILRNIRIFGTVFGIEDYEFWLLN